MNRTLYTIVFFLCILFVTAQDEEIKEIRKIYQETSDLITEAEKQEGGGLYSNEIIVNSNNGSWRAVGNYNKKITFWYNDDPDMAVQIYEDATPTSVLEKIVVDWSAAASMEYHAEYLFNNDTLIFCFIKERDYNDTETEFRYYFHDDELIRYMENQDIIENEPVESLKTIFKEVENYKDLFLKTF